MAATSFSRAACTTRICILVLGGLSLFVLGACTTPSTAVRGAEAPVFYPQLPQRPRLQFLRRFTGSYDLEEEESAFIRFLGGQPDTARITLAKPSDVATFDGVIYVTDTGLSAVAVFDLKAEELSLMGATGPGSLKCPVAITVDERGNKFVADSVRGFVIQFDAQNKYVTAYGDPESLRPTGVAVDEGHLYVVNRGANRVEVYDRETRELLRSFGRRGDTEGSLNTPTAITRDDEGHLYVTDAFNFRIQEFDTQGNYIKSYGWQGKTPGTFARPRGIDVDRSGHLYTLDGGSHYGQIFDTKSAQAILLFGGPGRAPGRMYLPASVHVDYALNPHFRELVAPGFELEYLVFVANNYGPNKVAVYGFVNPKDLSHPDHLRSVEEMRGR
jgi:DNA-binding beta-propeller fold protein YncE